MERLKLAIPKRSMFKPTDQLLKVCGFEYADYRSDARMLRLPVENRLIDLCFMNESDIPRVVRDGFADAGIASQIQIAEWSPELDQAVPLRFGRCRFVLGSPTERPYLGLASLQNKTVATTYVNVTLNQFTNRGINVNPYYLKGSVELACSMGISEAITDIVNTGDTMRKNGQQERETLFISEYVLVVGRLNGKQRVFNDLANELQLAVRRQTNG